ncbi:BREX-1 system adenine-specific DNA-methyltransferase PglX [Magnetovirga frankeli]|uniref:BREX-1 system adenine-specific DNA-methyltransferase PglX n=1 Tax=Magnetovirga frankeli TaxID=947516 RepID=UPI00129319B2|nr:BREX-1 system adenine-specific DNA-methyltransferase PglX [gamma proteobacterium SS-5]
METLKLKRFAQYARRSLMEQVSAKLKHVLAENSAARRERAEAIKKLEEAIKGHGKEQVIERVAYIWFNRFCALRFMDVNRYTRIGVVSPAEGQFQPEILAEAKMGHIDEEMVHDKVRQQIFALLDGKAPSRDPQGEAYRLLVVAACNFWNKAMPFLFQRIDDYTELLMPDDLLSGNSILAYTREAMTPDACQDVEVIGWLYQFYISEKKDEVFDGLKKNKKITPENIPAATQLFTPHWIVRYLVENSLGRLWLLNRPGSKLVEKMDYYIKPEEDLTTKNTNDTKIEKEENFRDFRAFRGSEKDFLVVNSPEEIKICDPACGSGHMLTYAFDLLYAIYEEEGYEPAEIPEKILTNNLYGVEIDERAGELAAFALTMKARAKQRRFFNKGVKPNICVLENVHFDEGELKEYMDVVGRDLFSAPLQTTLRQFEEADNFGSLIRPDVTDVDGMLRILESKNLSGQLFISMTHQKVLQALRQADYLSPKYHVVIANPPYMGRKSMNLSLKKFAQSEYQDNKLDAFAMFIERSVELVKKSGYISMLTMQSWMFLSSYKALRQHLLNSTTIQTLAQFGSRAFDTIGGGVVSTAAFVTKNAVDVGFKGVYLQLTDGESETEKQSMLLQRLDLRYTASANDFKRVDGSPISYWLPEAGRRAFEQGDPIEKIAEPRQGMATTDNNQFLRLWQEVSFKKIGFGCSSTGEAVKSGKKWFPYNKGGSFRKWYGNHEYVVNYENDGFELKSVVKEKYREKDYAQGFSDEKWDKLIEVWVLKNQHSYFLPALTWSFVSSSAFGVRRSDAGFIFDVGGSSAFPPSNRMNEFTSYLCSKVAYFFMSALNPTLNFQVENVAALPVMNDAVAKISKQVSAVAETAVALARVDWNIYETSWDFTSLPLLYPDNRQSTLKATYQKLRAHWREMTLEMQRLEQENNRIFIDAYGLQAELTPEVPLNEITLTCNPHYRYGNDKSEDELEALLLADTMRELVSYAVGCMFGRYALDKPGLILANQGETIEDYYKKIFNHEKHELHEKENQENFRDFRAFRGSCLFPADDDNVIPMLDGDWFTDDIAERFRKFLRVAFGDEHYEANLQFVEKALGKNGKARDIRDYFLKDFYTDHVKRYKKRPIYWLFSSGSGKSGGNFNALIYMHRYRPDTVSVVLNDYLREFRTKLTSHKNHLEAVSISASSSQGEKTKALKEIEKTTKMIAEMEEYEREVLYPLATEQVEIDLDDGVKVNYPKLGAALKKIVGLDAAED